jgi:hypothetical protein
MYNNPTYFHLVMLDLDDNFGNDTELHCYLNVQIREDSSYQKFESRNEGSFLYKISSY